AECRCLLFKETRNISFLNRSIDTFQIALGLQAWDIVDRGQMLVFYGAVVADRRRFRGDSGDLDRAIELLKEALLELALTETTSRDPLVVARLGTLLLERHREKWDDDDLNDGIELLSESVSLITADEPGRQAILNNLAVALITRYERLGSIWDMEGAIAHLREAVSPLSRVHPDRPSIINNLANALTVLNQSLKRILNPEVVVHYHEAMLPRSSTRSCQLPSLSNLIIVLI
ncbi:hypothetical protein FRB99_003689, partial [Tulasnella sp. 403]